MICRATSIVSDDQKRSIGNTKVRIGINRQDGGAVLQEVVGCI